MGLGWKIVVGVVVMGWWLAVGSRAHCPSCGVSLERDYTPDGPLRNVRVRDWCVCGWRRRREP